MLNFMLNDTGAPCPARTDMCIRNAVIITAIPVELSTNMERNKSLSDVAKLLAESPLSAIDNMRTGPLVTLQNGSKDCGFFSASDVLQCLMLNNSVKRHNLIIKFVVVH